MVEDPGIRSPGFGAAQPSGRSPFPPIADYAFLSDCEVTALVAPSGRGRVDVPAAAWTRRASSARCSTATPARSGSARRTSTVPAARRYLPGTMVLETTWGTPTRLDHRARRAAASGPWHHDDERSATHRRSPTDYDAEHVPAAHRPLRQRRGADLSMDCEPVFDYGRGRAAWEYTGDGYHEVVADRRGHDVDAAR